MIIFNIQELFHGHYSSLNEEAILKMSKSCHSNDLCKVVAGRKRHCYGLHLTKCSGEPEYQIYYVRGDEKLEGDLINLSANLKYRDELVFYFSRFLSHNYKDIYLNDLFNSFQEQTKKLLEKMGFQPVLSGGSSGNAETQNTISNKKGKGIIPIRVIPKEKKQHLRKAG